MKTKILIVLFLFVLIFVVSLPKKVEAETYTTFEHIDFKDDTDVVLLDEWGPYTLNGHMSKLKNKMFGWSLYYSLKKIPFSYVSETLYHVKNSGTKDITHTFKYEETYEETIQRNVNGSLDIDASYSNEKKKESKFKFGLEQELEFEYKQQTKTKTTESDTVKIVIAPNSELYIKVKGEGLLYQGVAKKYLVYIVLKSGGFEYAVITTEYYSIEMNPIDENYVVTEENDNEEGN